MSDLWPTGSEENEEVTIREIPGESFDPEDTEEIEIATNNESNEITIIDQINDDNNNEVELVLNEEREAEQTIQFFGKPEC